jgi:ATP-binding cassette, subfamily C (CFTR/MRP), member 1
VLKDINIAIPAGTKVAICGRSGSGKTSFILSLLQMISIKQGTITVDGLDLATINRVELRDRINVVTQEPLLMPGTVRFNIDPYGTASGDSIATVLSLLKLWRRVSDVGGLDSELDPDAWSVGEKQLLCFARALCRGSKLVILDEAMSRYAGSTALPDCQKLTITRACSVDRETAAVMQGVIDSEWKSCTVLSVMHRLDSISNFDVVVVLDHGEVTECANPTALLANENSALSKLYRAGDYGAHASTSDESS